MVDPEFSTSARVCCVLRSSLLTLRVDWSGSRLRLPDMFVVEGGLRSKFKKKSVSR